MPGGHERSRKERETTPYSAISNMAHYGSENIKYSCQDKQSMFPIIPMVSWSCTPFMMIVSMTKKVRLPRLAASTTSFLSCPSLSLCFSSVPFLSLPLLVTLCAFLVKQTCQITHIDVTRGGNHFPFLPVLSFPFPCPFAWLSFPFASLHYFLSVSLPLFHPFLPPRVLS